MTPEQRAGWRQFALTELALDAYNRPAAGLLALLAHIDALEARVGVDAARKVPQGRAPVTMPADRAEQIAKAIAADDSCISAGKPADALAAERDALRADAEGMPTKEEA